MLKECNKICSFLQKYTVKIVFENQEDCANIILILQSNNHFIIQSSTSSWNDRREGKALHPNLVHSKYDFPQKEERSLYVNYFKIAFKRFVELYKYNTYWPRKLDMAGSHEEDLCLLHVLITV